MKLLESAISEIPPPKHKKEIRSRQNIKTDAGISCSDSSLPSLRDVLRRSITDVKDIEAGVQQKRSCSRSHHSHQTTAERRGSVEIAESPSRSDDTSNFHILGITTVITGSQDKGDSTTERSKQHKGHSSKRWVSSILPSKRQLVLERRSNRNS